MKPLCPQRSRPPRDTGPSVRRRTSAVTESTTTPDAAARAGASAAGERPGVWAVAAAAIPPSSLPGVYWPITRAYFFADDFIHLVSIANDGFIRFVFRPYAGHNLAARNLVFWASARLFGLRADLFFWTVLVTHLLNVWLLFRIARSLTGSLALACIGASLASTNTPRAVAQYAAVQRGIAAELAAQHLGHGDARQPPVARHPRSARSSVECRAGRTLPRARGRLRPRASRWPAGGRDACNSSSTIPPCSRGMPGGPTRPSPCSSFLRRADPARSVSPAAIAWRAHPAYTPAMEDTVTRYRTCSLCEATCGLDHHDARRHRGRHPRRRRRSVQPRLPLPQGSGAEAPPRGPRPPAPAACSGAARPGSRSRGTTRSPRSTAGCRRSSASTAATPSPSTSATPRRTSCR